jgi:LysR family transcriptional regulator, pca operon transcriptional activator
MPDTDAPAAGPARREQALGRIRLRHLQCFLAVAESAHLGRAAQALCITQPAVTKTLNELEALLGTRLFVRGRQGAAMTAEAEVFLRHASTTVQALGLAVDSVLGSAEQLSLRIGVLPTVAPSLMPQVLASFLADRPQVAVRLHTGRNASLLAQLRARELDVVIGRLSEPEAMLGLTFEHLYAEPLVLALRVDHPLLPLPDPGAALAALPRVMAFPLLLPLSGTLIRQVADDFLGRHQLQPRAGVVETLDTAVAQAMVLSTDALWLTPLGAAQPALNAGWLQRWPLQITPEEPVGLLQRNDALPSPALQALLGLVRLHGAARRSQRAGGHR